MPSGGDALIARFAPTVVAGLIKLTRALNFMKNSFDRFTVY